MAFGGETAESYYDEGLTASMRGDVDHAIQYFERALHMDRSFLAARHQLAKAYTKVGRGADAVSLLSDVVARRPDNVVARLDLGAALLSVGNIADARKQFNFVIELDVNNPRAYLGLAETFFDEGNWNAAVMQAQQSIAAGGNSFQALYLLGRAARYAQNIFLSQETLERADKLLEQSIESSPDNPEPYYFRGEIAFVSDRFGPALDMYRAAEKRAEPGKVYASFGESFTWSDILAKQALCFQRMDQPDRARDMARRILETDPEHKIARSLVAPDQ